MEAVEPQPLVDVLKWVFDIGEPPPPPGGLIKERQYVPELVIGFAKPQGTDNSKVSSEVERHLNQHGFLCQPVSISSLLADAATLVSTLATPAQPFDPNMAGFKKTLQLMRWGDNFRKSMTDWEMARFAVASISYQRPQVQAKAIGLGKSGVAYLVRNLMHQAEVGFFRTIYKQRFYLIATHQPEDQRRAALIEDFRLHDSNGSPKDHATQADLILKIDMGERSAEMHEAFPWDIGVPSDALNLNETFHRGDLFVGHDNFESTIDRWANQLFGFPWGTPTLTELGMSVAYDAARMSGAFGRSVGAALVNGDSVVALGWNDSAKPEGGLSRVDSEPNLQEHWLSPPVDPSDGNRLETVRELLSRLFDPEWDELYDQDQPNLTAAQAQLRDWLRAMRAAAKDHGQPITDDMVSAMASLTALSSSRVFSLIEFGRTVHAEMAAITDAARRGVSTQGATLYVTTFPCHECSRNIVAAGIEKVVFVEPYSKSLTNALYINSIQNLARESVPDSKRVAFEPFIGISPSRFNELFSNVKRKYGISDAVLAKKGDKKVGTEVEWNVFARTLRPSVRGYFLLPNSEEYDLFEKSRRLAEEAVCASLKVDFKAVFPEVVESLSTITDNK